MRSRDAAEIKAVAAEINELVNDLNNTVAALNNILITTTSGQEGEPDDRQRRPATS